MDILAEIQQRVENSINQLRSELRTSHDIELDVEILKTKEGVQVVMPSKTKKRRKGKPKDDVE